MQISFLNSCMLNLKAQLLFHVHHDVITENPRYWLSVAYERSANSSHWRWITLSSRHLFWWHWNLSETLQLMGGVWLGAAWWKTACQMGRGSIHLGCWPLHARWRDKWIPGATFGRLAESVACRLLSRSSRLPLVNGPTFRMVELSLVDLHKQHPCLEKQH